MVTAAWDAERPGDLPRARRLLERLVAATPLAAAVDAASLAPLDQGWDNTVLVTDDGWALRLPRRAVALPGVLREAALLPAVAPLLPLAVPVPAAVALDDDPEDPWPFTLARLLPGRELAGAGPGGTARVDLAADVGAFLRALHAPAAREAALSAVAAAGAALAVDPMQRGWPRPRGARVRDGLDRLVAAGAWTGDRAVAELLDRADRLDAPGDEPVLVHGDLHVRHVLVGGDGRASGVIDWGDACLADPAVDLSIAFAAFAGPARTALLDAYGHLGAERELRARATAVRLAALLAEHGAAASLDALLAEALACLRRAVA